MDEGREDRDYWTERYGALDCQDCGEEVYDHELDEDGYPVCSPCERAREEC